MKLYDYLFWIVWVFYVADLVYFSKRRDNKWYAQKRKELVDGIIEDLKKSDTVLVINETDKAHNKLLIKKGPEAIQ